MYFVTSIRNARPVAVMAANPSFRECESHGGRVKTNPMCRD